ncbi:hypothetical protein [Streptomyces subrutilus]|uniref:HAF repeat-containing protein n=1 Tax=Streptomyces subrutilus TaxID=36818 RepID=A0A1E5PZ36_9ACTN|nr:hypothetical protein [Streptomyces subrutilus]OEJ34825.1 hypothetical protein BGK67_28945 [Streptomyces subrutilus]
MRGTTSAAAAAAVLAGLITAAGPAAAAAPACTPGVTVLPSLTGGPAGSVRAFGPDGLAVGASSGLPAYWTADGRVHAVPMPEGFQEGTVTAVNGKGLMAGTVRSTAQGNPGAAFTYQLGAGSVRLITATSAHSGGAQVNDAGHVVALDDGVTKEWVNGKVARELPVPADAHPGTVISSVNGINKRGDVLGTAHTDYWDQDNDQIVSKTFPVVWPAGGYPTASLPVRNDGDPTIGTHATGIDDKGRVVGYEKLSHRDWQERKPAVWKRPYDALPAGPGLVAGYEHLTLDAVSPTTNTAVGTAVTFVEGYPHRLRAAYWAGTGAAKALPHPAGGTQDARSEAFAVSDDDRVGGSYWGWDGVGSGAVIWTCAGRQAYTPQS